MFKYKKIVVFFILVFLLSTINFCLAQDDNNLEVKYPKVGRLTLSSTSTFPQYIRYIYHFLIWISGIVLMLILIKAGFSYMTSTGNPARMKDAKNQIIAGIIGIIVIFFSYLILYTINPQIVGKEVEIESKETETGIYLKDEEGSKIMVGDDIYDTHNFQGHEICFPQKKGVGIKKIKTIYLFSQKNFQGEPKEISRPYGYSGCQSILEGKPIKSVKIDWNMPGVYVWARYKSSISLPYLIKGTTFDLNTIPALSGTSSWDGVEFRNSATSDLGAIFFQDVDFRKKGKIMFGIPGSDKTFSKPFAPPSYQYNPQSVYIFDKTQADVFVILYNSPKFQEQREEMSPPPDRSYTEGQMIDRSCICATYTEPILDSPRSLPNQCINGRSLRSLKIDHDSTTSANLVILLQNPISHGDEIDFDKAEPFTKSDPDLSDNYIGRCTSTSPSSPRWMDWYSIYRCCATDIMIFPIRK